MVSSTTRLAPTRRSRRRGSRRSARSRILQPRRSRTDPPGTRAPRAGHPALKLVQIKSERPHVEGDLGRRLLESHEHAGLAVLAGRPTTRKFSPSSVLPAPALPATSVTRPGQAAPGDQRPGPESRWAPCPDRRPTAPSVKFASTVLSMCSSSAEQSFVSTVSKLPGNYEANRHIGPPAKCSGIIRRNQYEMAEAEQLSRPACRFP